MSLICPKCGHDLGENLDIVEKMCIDHIMNPGPLIPKPKGPTCSGCDFVEWYDADEHNLEYGYWYCNKYYQCLDSTWNDYGCYKLEECNE